MAKKPRGGKPAGEEIPTAGGAEDLPERWSAQRKMELAPGLDMLLADTSGPVAPGRAGFAGCA